MRLIHSSSHILKVIQPNKLTILSLSVAKFLQTFFFTFRFSFDFQLRSLAIEKALSFHHAHHCDQFHIHHSVRWIVMSVSVYLPIVILFSAIPPNLFDILFVFTFSPGTFHTRRSHDFTTFWIGTKQKIAASQHSCKQNRSFHLGCQRFMGSKIASGTYFYSVDRSY